MIAEVLRGRRKRAEKDINDALRFLEEERGMHGVEKSQIVEIVATGRFRDITRLATTSHTLRKMNREDKIDGRTPTPTRLNEKPRTLWYLK